MTKNFDLEKEYRDCIKSRGDKIRITRYIISTRVHVHRKVVRGGLHVNAVWYIKVYLIKCYILCSCPMKRVTCTL